VERAVPPLPWPLVRFFCRIIAPPRHPRAWRVEARPSLVEHSPRLSYPRNPQFGIMGRVLTTESEEGQNH
jgi:hypothetical protein